MFRMIVCSALLLAAFLPGGIARAQDLQPRNSVLAPAETGPADSAPAPGETLSAPQGVETRTLDLGSAQAPAPETKAIDPADIPDVLMDEVKVVERLCVTNYMYSSFHDCRCVAVKFLDARIKSDPKTSRDTVFKQVAAQCVNQVGIIDYVYPSCHDIMKLRHPDTYRQLCECTARNVAAAYKAQPEVNLYYIERLRNKAFRECGLVR